MENETLLKNFAWLCFISNTVGVVILIDFIIFNKPYITVFILTFSVIFYSNYKFFIFFRAGRVQEKLAKKSGLKLSAAFFRIYFGYIFSLLLPEATWLLSRPGKKGQ
jgi:hypothetical protein